MRANDTMELASFTGMLKGNGALLECAEGLADGEELVGLGLALFHFLLPGLQKLDPQWVPGNDLGHSHAGRQARSRADAGGARRRRVQEQRGIRAALKW